MHRVVALLPLACETVFAKVVNKPLRSVPGVAKDAITADQRRDGGQIMMNSGEAEATALKCLTWLIANDDLRTVFMGATGLGEDELRARYGEPEFLAAVLDFLLMDDTWLMQCCDAQGLPYEAIGAARAALPGGQDVSWT